MEEQIKERLAAVLGKSADSLTLESSDYVEWSDSGLGCHAPGMMYMQVITPGYRLRFSDGTASYEVHTGRLGTPAIWCDDGRPRSLA
jgi:hypothetical protein